MAQLRVCCLTLAVLPARAAEIKAGFAATLLVATRRVHDSLPDTTGHFRLVLFLF
jgi:hypothetical protein